MPTTLERLLTVGTHEVLWMPHLAHAMNDTPLNGTPARSTDRRLHVVIATEAVQFSVLFPAFGSQCFSTVVAVEVMRVHHLELVHNVVTMDWETGEWE